MPRSAPVDGFALAYDRTGAGSPGRAAARLARRSHRLPRARAAAAGDARRRRPRPARLRRVRQARRSTRTTGTRAAAQAAAWPGWSRSSGSTRPSWPATTSAAASPRRSPGPRRSSCARSSSRRRCPAPATGCSAPDAQRAYWYQAFHRLELAEELVDGDRDAVRAYLRHFWSHWSGPAFALPDADLDAARGPLRGAGRVRRVDRLVPRGIGHRRREPRREPRPRRRTGSPCRPACCGPSTTRCSRGRGRDRLDAFFADVTVTRPARRRPLLAARGAAGVRRRAARRIAARASVQPAAGPPGSQRTIHVDHRGDPMTTFDHHLRPRKPLTRPAAAHPPRRRPHHARHPLARGARPLLPGRRGAAAAAPARPHRRAVRVGDRSTRRRRSRSAPPTSPAAASSRACCSAARGTASPPASRR